jgi:hypothetical protein
VTSTADRLAVARQHVAVAIDTLGAQAATETIGQALRDGLGPVELIEDAIAPSQRLVGERWERGDWAVAQQHAATGLATAAVCALDAAMPAADRGLVVLACAEREWHALPLRRGHRLGAHRAGTACPPRRPARRGAAGACAATRGGHRAGGPGCPARDAGGVAGGAGG